MSSESVYKLKIEGDGLIFEREISKEVGDKILILILSGGKQSTATPIPTGVSSSQEEKTLIHKRPSDVSVREFLDDHNAKRNPDMITALGLYLHDHNQQNSFTKEDILNAFEAAAEPAPKNFARDLKWAIKIGWVAEKRDMKDNYYVTASGKTAVNTSFPDDLIKKTKVPLKPKKASSKKAQENES
jgi:hypothetical protein